MSKVLTKTIDDYLSHTGETNYMVDGKCIDCNDCCSIFTPVSKDELKILKRRFSKSLLRKYVDKGEGINLYCPFSVENKCVVYDVRPLVCKSYACDKTHMSHMLELFGREVRGENKYRILEVLPDGQYKDILYEIAHQKYGYNRGGNK